MSSERTTRSRKKTRSSGVRAKRESGEPGGGKGRRDIVRGSRVYPMSGPLPRGNAVIRTEAAWGQGERGAAGYEDSGESGLNVMSGARRFQRGHRRTIPAARRRPSLRQAEAETLREIPQRQWMKFFDNFSRQHEGWLAEVEVRQRGARRRVEARRLPFEGITVDLKRGAHKTTAIILEMQPNVHLTHMLPNTRQVHFKEQPPELELQITASSGEKAIVHFRAPARSPKLLPPPKSR